MLSVGSGGSESGEDLHTEASSSVRIQAHPDHYSLRWQHHQIHLLHYFDSLFQSERMVDVTLVCQDLSIRAHKVVLSACSPYLQRLLADNPCSHPVVVLQDVSAWELQAIISFMYRGEISVPQEHIASLVKVAETLKVRGLTKMDTINEQKSSPQYTSSHLMSPSTLSKLSRDLYSKLSPECATPPAKIPHLASGNVFHNGFSYESHTSSLPRRKQARPRRRSGDSIHTPTVESCKMSTPSPIQDAPEDLSVKKSPFTLRQDSEDATTQGSSRGNTPLPTANTPSFKAESLNNDSIKSEFSLGERSTLFSPGPSTPLTTPPTQSSPLLTPLHQDRRKGQHSAPRGGPPRAWTNADLTEALHHVWNRKMTTSQASRVFGIPYNSLLMYVRGKYGKSLKLDTLRKETLEGEAMALAASTRGSYKLAAAASNSSSHNSPNSSNNSSGKPSPGLGVNGGLTSNTTNNSNNNTTTNNNNNNNNESKISKNSPAGSHLHLGGLNLSGYPSLPQMGEVDAHALTMGLGLGGFGGLASGINPYLSYFCDFSFPMPMMGLIPSAGKQRTADTLKKNERKTEEDKRKETTPTADTSSDVEADTKEDSVTEEEGPSPSPPSVNLRLGPSLLSPMDLPQTGQV